MYFFTHDQVEVIDEEIVVLSEGDEFNFSEIVALEERCTHCIDSRRGNCTLYELDQNSMRRLAIRCLRFE